MKFTLKELFAGILKSDLPEEEKVNLIERIMTRFRITDNFYLKRDVAGYYECWFRSINENGTTEYGPTNYIVEQVVNEYAKSIVSNTMKKSKKTRM